MTAKHLNKKLLLYCTNKYMKNTKTLVAGSSAGKFYLFIFYF